MCVKSHRIIYLTHKGQFYCILSFFIENFCRKLFPAIDSLESSMLMLEEHDDNYFHGLIIYHATQSSSSQVF